EEPSEELAPPARGAAPRAPAPRPPEPPPAQAPMTSPSPAPGPVMARPASPGLEAALRTVMYRLQQSFDVQNADPRALHDQARWTAAQKAVAAAVSSAHAEGRVPAEVDPNVLSDLAVREAVGLGALEGLLSDDRVRE